MIKLTQVRKSFAGREVLKGVDIHVDKGEVVGVLGPSGSGKTTLLRIANFLETADSGELDFEGEKINLAHAAKRDAARMRLKTGFVFQNYNLFRNLSALENVTEGLRIVRGLSRKEADEIGRECLFKVGLADRADHYPNQLSGGQQQRVGIARAMAADPEIIYFDEPTSALDPELVEEVMTVIRNLADEGRTMMIVTHELEFVRQTADRIVFMDQGRVVETAQAQAFFSSPRKARTQQFLARYLRSNLAAA